MDAEQLAYNFFLLGFALTGVSFICYVAIPLWPRVAYRAAATEAGSLTVATPAEPPRWLAQAAIACTWLAFAALTASLAARWVAAGHPPYANMWEYTVGFGWGVLLFAIIFDLRTHQRAIVASLLPVALLLFGVSLAFFPSEVRPLVPALQSNRILGAHVAMMILSYAAFSVSFGAAVLYLAQGERPQPRFSWLPARATLDDIGYRSVLIGFPMLAAGIGLGAWWASEAWTRYWGWDPKETSALVTWLIYAGYLHARGLRGWRGNRAAWLLILGFAAVMFTYFAVNLWISGLHSYSGV
jgi:cytochrome c-type biogenesis protein CcsB